MSLKLLENDYGSLRDFRFGGGGEVLSIVEGKFLSVHIKRKNVEGGV